MSWGAERAKLGAHIDRLGWGTCLHGSAQVLAVMLLSNTYTYTDVYLYRCKKYRLSWFYYADMLNTKCPCSITLALLSGRLGNSKLWISAPGCPSSASSPGLFPVLLASSCPSSTLAKPVPVSLHQLIPTASPSFFPSLPPTWLSFPTRCQFSSPLLFHLHFFFSFAGFSSAKAARAAMFIACKVYALEKRKKKKSACLRCRKIIWPTSYWHLNRLGVFRHKDNAGTPASWEGGMDARAARRAPSASRRGRSPTGGMGQASACLTDAARYTAFESISVKKSGCKAKWIMQLIIMLGKA